jgi:hypothetical protein
MKRKPVPQVIASPIPICKVSKPDHCIRCFPAENRFNAFSQSQAYNLKKHPNVPFNPSISVFTLKG